MKRHPQHDYFSPGGYFVTFITADRNPVLGSIQGNEIKLSPSGRIVTETWESLPGYYPNLRLDAFQVMPDHVHANLLFIDKVFVEGQEGKLGDLSKVIQAFKAITARKIRRLPGLAQVKVWQKGFRIGLFAMKGN